jgi:hypothetical protein
VPYSIAFKDYENETIEELPGPGSPSIVIF